MSNPWFRLYNEWDSDPKVQSMPEVMQRRLIMLFCSKCRGGGMSDAERSFHWRISEEDLAATKALFIAKGFIDKEWNPLKWDERQFLSDSSAERVKKYRDKRASSGLPRGSSHLRDKALYERDGNRCIYCASPQNLCIDHIFPISQGGSDHYDNLGVACKSCNSGKAGRTLHQSKYKIINTDAASRYERYVTVTWISEQSVPGVTVTVTAQEQIRTEAEQIQRQKEPLASTANAVPADKGKLLGTLPLSDGSHWEVFAADVDELQPLYPAVDVRGELRAMKGWLIGNPTYRKTRRGIRRFITSWLAKEQDKAKPGGVHGSRRAEGSTSKFDRSQASTQRVLNDLLGGQSDLDIATPPGGRII